MEHIEYVSTFIIKILNSSTLKRDISQWSTDDLLVRAEGGPWPAASRPGCEFPGAVLLACGLETVDSIVKSCAWPWNDSTVNFIMIIVNEAGTWLTIIIVEHAWTSRLNTDDTQCLIMKLEHGDGWTWLVMIDVQEWLIIWLYLKLTMNDSCGSRLTPANTLSISHVRPRIAPISSPFVPFRGTASWTSRSLGYRPGRDLTIPWVNPTCEWGW